MFQKLITFLPLFVIVSCSRSYKLASVVPGKTTTIEALKILGEPSEVKENGERLVYRDSKIFSKDGMVESISRAPSSTESTLQYWMHKSSHESLKLIQSNGEEDLYQLSNMKVNILYQKSKDKVLEVTIYE